MADQLATSADLASYLQQSLDASTATLLLETATGLVQGAVGQRLVQVTNDPITLMGRTGSWLDLPERPVTAVAAVTLDGEALAEGTAAKQYRRHGSRLFRVEGWQKYLYEPSPVTVTYTHGYPTGDQRLQLARGIVLALAGQAYAEPTGVTSEAIDDYRVTYSQAIQRMELTEHAKAALRRAYGRRAGLVQLGGS